MKNEFLELPAIEVVQGPGRLLYSFAVDGKLVPQFAAISRIKRAGRELEGYQRPEVLAHIGEIRDYIDSADPMIPNAIVVAFDSRVKFTPAHGAPVSGICRTGVLKIPLVSSPDDRRCGFIVDGQQRLAAIRDAQRASFPICVTAFITNDLGKQTEQFILVNSTKPLPKGLIYELLPSTATTLPTQLRRKRLPAYLLNRLNRDADSPLERMIRTPTMPDGLIKDNSILKMLENSLSDGALYRLKETNDGTSPDTMVRLLNSYWSAVREVFSDDWGLPPTRSRLMHGAGIVSMGFVMDAIAERRRAKATIDRSAFVTDLKPLKAICRWRNGTWHFPAGNQRKWNEIQNTSKDIQRLSQFLLTEYKRRVDEN